MEVRQIPYEALKENLFGVKPGTMIHLTDEFGARLAVLSTDWAEIRMIPGVHIDPTRQDTTTKESIKFVVGVLATTGRPVVLAYSGLMKQARVWIREQGENVEKFGEDVEKLRKEVEKLCENVEMLDEDVEKLRKDVEKFRKEVLEILQTAPTGE